MKLNEENLVKELLGFEEYLKQFKLKERTKQFYIGIIKQALTDSGKQLTDKGERILLNDLSIESIRKYIAAYNVANYRSAFQHFCNYKGIHGELPKRIGKEHKELPKVTRDKLKTILDKLKVGLSKLDTEDKKGKDHLQLWYIFRTMFLTGCRVNEAVNIKMKDINLEDRTLTFPITKSGKPREVLRIDLEFFAEMVNYFAKLGRNGEDYLFFEEAGKKELQKSILQNELIALQEKQKAAGATNRQLSNEEQKRLTKLEEFGRKEGWNINSYKITLQKLWHLNKMLALARDNKIITKKEYQILHRTHSFRRIFITHLYHLTQNIVKTQHHVGHKSPETTEGYLTEEARQKDIEEAAEDLEKDLLKEKQLEKEKADHKVEFIAKIKNDPSLTDEDKKILIDNAEEDEIYE